MDFDALKNAPPLDTAILATSVTSAVLYLVSVRSQPTVGRMISKTASTALLAVLAARRFGITSPLVPALALGSLGDAFLAWPGEDNFLRGLGSFLVAHLFYIALFALAGNGVDQIWADPWRQGLAGFMLLLAPAMGSQLVPSVSAKLRSPIVTYSTVILAMVLAVLTVKNDTVVAGAVMFALSDSVLATDEFLVPEGSAHHGWMQYTVWILYYTGQLLIACGF
ncbi:hypothetical protein K4F52_003789 [Lecanicillium sp. MT-2017a]|nr:hypothetical protein K4F52_003789 [Lecanicillium sp. MT-2017a]